MGHWAQPLAGGPTGRLWDLRACLTSSFTPFGHSSRVLLHMKGGGYPGRHRADSERISMKLGLNIKVWKFYKYKFGKTTTKVS